MAETPSSNVDVTSRTSGGNNGNTGQGSGNSGGTMSVVSHSTKGGGRQKKSTEEISDRKKIKVLKQAMKDDRAGKAVVQEELDLVKERMKELRKENEVMSNKYLALYDENDKLQELLNTMQFRI